MLRFLDSLPNTFTKMVSVSRSEITTRAQCLKITEKVSFNIASEASYVYILSGQKLIKNAKNRPFWRVFEKFKCDILSNFQTMWRGSRS